jgi:hypothetical protein
VDATTRSPGFSGLHLDTGPGSTVSVRADCFGAVIEFSLRQSLEMQGRW